MFCQVFGKRIIFRRYGIMAQLSDSQIEAMMKKGFTRWTKGDKDRLYIKGWNIDGVTTNWKKEWEEDSHHQW